MANANRPVLSLRRGSDKNSISITVRSKKDNAKSRRLAKQMAFWDRKRAEYDAKPKSRSVEEIWDNIFNPVDEIDVLVNLIVSLKKDISNDNNGSCCLPNAALYSTKNKTPRRRLVSGGVTARG
ncbi:hypothetical protein ID850_17625 [Xenorhabdus sp. Flor]|uniref:hypothetical protein n=1 Tax=Xenorhabdus cabanillasii TaxID=351673 RepID=UPI0019A0F128|nr:hypothetical protein [Xenorhabdus sp. Flor]MBD2816519.1 hypothetical protein [Xenorhabdus sp. Flor]